MYKPKRSHICIEIIYNVVPFKHVDTAFFANWKNPVSFIVSSLKDISALWDIMKHLYLNERGIE